MSQPASAARALAHAARAKSRLNPREHDARHAGCYRRKAVDPGLTRA
jgi:hypothetical protein